MTMFPRKLKNNVNNELMPNGTFIKNFEKLIEQTIEIDNKLYEQIMEKRHDGNGFCNHKYGYKNSGFNDNKQYHDHHLNHINRYRWNPISCERKKTTPKR